MKLTPANWIIPAKVQEDKKLYLALSQQVVVGLPSVVVLAGVSFLNHKIALPLANQWLAGWVGFVLISFVLLRFGLHRFSRLVYFFLCR